MIQASLVEEIKDARLYTIMVDEVTSNNTELMPLCVRFVDSELNIREELLQICTLPRITGHHIATAIKQVLLSLGIAIEGCRGQGYDGSANMSSETVGVQALIRQDAPKAVYTHCSGHCLNLVIAHSCSLPIVRNTLDRIKATVMFFTNSPNRELLLREVATQGGHPMGLRQPLIDVCRTRWAARHDAYSHFYTSFTHIVKALEVIGLRLHLEDYSEDVTTGWDGKYRTEASGLLSGVVKFEFIVTFLTVYQTLSHLAGMTVKLQSTTLDIVRAYQMVEDIKAVYSSLRENIAVHFTKIYDQAVRMAAAVDVEPAKPRGHCAVRQTHRSNAPAETAEEYYLRNMAIPLVDHVVTELDSQFSRLSVVSSSLLGLVPSVLLQEDIDIAGALELYRDDLPTPELFDQELACWRLKWQRKSDCAEQIPATCAATIQECDPVLFPNMFMLLKVACTLPVTSCECDRSASTLRRLNTFMRASMGEERLSSLALIHTHYDKPIDLDKAVDLFAKLHPRKMELINVLTA